MSTFHDVERTLSSDVCSFPLAEVPRHVAIIMDGNRRWARERGLSPWVGHWKGAEVLTEVVRSAAEWGVKTLTVYAFSTENWLRSEEERKGLMRIFQVFLQRKKKQMLREGVRLDAIGDLSRLPSGVQKAFDSARKMTQDCRKINLVLALNYGGRDEICRMVRKILKRHDAQPWKPEEITEELIEGFLDTQCWGSPDFLIRTSGEMRWSNFLIWQTAYTEFYSTPVLWPDFSPDCMRQALLAYQKRIKRRGR